MTILILTNNPTAFYRDYRELSPRICKVISNENDLRGLARGDALILHKNYSVPMTTLYDQFQGQILYIASTRDYSILNLNK